MRTLIIVTLLLAVSINASSQQLSSKARAQEIAASFNKFKHVFKEKLGVRREKYKDVRSEPLVKENISGYAGLYEISDLGFVITIQVGSDGKVEANGYQQSRAFRLENARITGALLTAMKVYQDGATEKFEGVFLTRTDRNSPTDKGVTTFGLGVLLDSPFEVSGLTYDKLFYQLKQ